MRSILLAIALATMPALAAAQSVDDGSSFAETEHEIRAVIADYFWGRQTGNPERLGRAFNLDNGQFAYVRRTNEGDEVIAMSLADFAARADGPLSAPNTGRILSLDIVGDQMAFVKFELAGESRTFIDYFVLYRVNQRWMIQSKTSAMFQPTP
ncbi:nuclear transport factor 2 family protein [Maricaulis sp. W15]|uniref:nuclear transport factor 2 family protein n=1 Tax=Maricaulis sp. W15 TaxID=1772333 RepID=UPI000AF54091|nr:nuclear transport factor 2 family protein [Maricaulis sp. W15]